MKRYPVVIGATIAGVAGVLSYHTQRLTTSALSTRAGAIHTTTRADARPARTAGGTSPAGTVPPTSSPQAPSGGTTGPSASSRTITGTKEQYGYGVLSVRVTAQGSKITDVAVASLQTADTYSTQLADTVIPYLKREVLHAQGSRVSAITGATYTSEAYALSVQSALDKLRR